MQSTNSYQPPLTDTHFRAVWLGAVAEFPYSTPSDGNTVSLRTSDRGSHYLGVHHDRTFEITGNACSSRGTLSRAFPLQGPHQTATPTMAPMVAVKAIASAPHKVTRSVALIMLAPPAFAPRAPSKARNKSDAIAT